MASIVIWRPEALNARLRAAARPAAQDFARLAAARAPSRRVAASVKAVGSGEHWTVGSADPLGGLLERGTRPHEIEPKRKKVLKTASGGYTTTVRHPGMKAQPWLRPTLPLWPSLYRRRASFGRGGLGGLL